MPSSCYRHGPPKPGAWTVLVLRRLAREYSLGVTDPDLDTEDAAQTLRDSVMYWKLDDHGEEMPLRMVLRDVTDVYLGQDFNDDPQYRGAARKLAEREIIEGLNTRRSGLRVVKTTRTVRVVPPYENSSRGAGSLRTTFLRPALRGAQIVDAPRPLPWPACRVVSAPDRRTRPTVADRGTPRPPGCKGFQPYIFERPALCGNAGRGRALVRRHVSERRVRSDQTSITDSFGYPQPRGRSFLGMSYLDTDYRWQSGVYGGLVTARLTERKGEP